MTLLVLDLLRGSERFGIGEPASSDGGFGKARRPVSMLEHRPPKLADQVPVPRL